MGPIDRSAVDASADPDGNCRLETGYRRTARIMESAFAAATAGVTLHQSDGFPPAIDLTTLHERELSRIVVHTWDIFRGARTAVPAPAGVTQRALRAVVEAWRSPLAPAATGSGGVVDSAAWECLIRLSGREA